VIKLVPLFEKTLRKRKLLVSKRWRMDEVCHEHKRKLVLLYWRWE